MGDEAEIPPNNTISALLPLPGAHPLAHNPYAVDSKKLASHKFRDRFQNRHNSPALATHFSSDNDGELDESAE